jgi:tetratricopeptide (TPR) repeat protein
MPAALLALALSSVLSAQTRLFMRADEARDIFNTGQRFYDEYKYTDAENKFREVVQRFPKNPIADRAAYYLIRTLSQAGKRNEALDRINAFAKQYPKSRWLDDIQEVRLQLTSQVSPQAESILLRQAPPAPPAPAVPPAPAIEPLRPGQAPRVPTPRPPRPPRQTESTDPEISLQQEIMRAMFRNNVGRAIEIAMERLKANMADPVVLSTLNMVATSASAQALPMLLEIARNSPNAKARKDAIFWISQSRGDKDAIVDTLTGLLPALSEEDSDAVTFALSQIRTDKSFNALATIARDKTKPEKARTNALFWIGQSRSTNRVSLLEDIYKNGMDSQQVRQQALYALSQTRDPQAVTILGNIAASDPDIELRKQAVVWLGRINSPEATQALENLLRKK